MSEQASKGYYQIQRLCLFSHSGKEYEFDKNFEVLYYLESIDRAFVEGHVTFLDSHDIIVNNSIVGGERLLFEYKITSDAPTITKNFIVSSINTSSDSSQRNVHTIGFFSEEFFNSKNSSISRSYKDKTANQIVEDLFKEINTRNCKLITEKTKGSHHIIVPNYDPFFGIDLVRRYAQHPSYKGGNYFFFQNSYGFNFLCLESMMDKEPIAKFYKNMQKVDTGAREKTGSLLKITQISGNPDLIESISTGMLASKYICYDPIAKSYKKIEFNYNKNFKEMKHLNEFPVTFKESTPYSSPDQYVSYFPSNSIRKQSTYFTSKSDSTTHSNELDQSLPYINCGIPRLFSKEYEIAIKGDDVTSLWQTKQKMFTCGQVIEMEQKTKSVDAENANKEHTYFNGKYLIYNCTHTFNKEGYVVSARVCSDSNIAAHNRR